MYLTKSKAQNLYNLIKITPSVIDSTLENILAQEWDKNYVPADYREYLIDSINILNKQARTSGGAEITIPIETLINEFPFWRSPNFIWPFILHNHQGQVVYNWRIDGTVFELERRNLNGNILFLGKKYNVEDYINLESDTDTQSVTPQKFTKSLFEFMEESYIKLQEQGVDWKSYLAGKQS